MNSNFFEDALRGMDPEERILVDTQMAIATRIDELCQERGLTQKDLADLLDMHESQVSRILSGCQNLTLRTLARIEARLGAKIINVVASSGERREAA